MKPALAILTVVIIISPVFALDFYVSTAGSDQNPGTQTQPFATIQHAIDACPQTPQSNIHLDASNWNETPTITAKDIKLIGDYNGPHGMGGKYSTHINGAISFIGEQYYTHSLSIQSLSAYGVIQSGSYYPPLAEFVSELDDVDLSNPSGYGISCFACNSVTNSNIHNCNSDGIHVGSNSGTEITGNTVNNCTGRGIFFSGDDSVIDGNIVRNNSQTGIYCSDAGGCIISNNLVVENGADGIYIYGYCNPLSVCNNICSQNAANGLKRFSQSGLVSHNNTISNNVFGSFNNYLGNGMAGIHLQIQDATGVCESNLIQGNGSYGIRFVDTIFKVFNNTIINNESYGVYFTSYHSMPDLGGGRQGSPGGNLIANNGTYEAYNISHNNVYAKYNNWDELSEAEMAGGSPKKVNVTRIYDIWEFWSPLLPLTGAVIWGGPFKDVDKIEPKASKIQPVSLGRMKASYK